MSAMPNSIDFGWRAAGVVHGGGGSDDNRDNTAIVSNDVPALLWPPRDVTRPMCGGNGMMSTTQLGERRLDKWL